MALVKLDVVRCDFAEYAAGFLQAIVLVHKTDQDFHVSRFGDQASFPARVGKIVENFWLLVFLNLVRIPSTHEENKIVGVPIGAFESSRVVLGFRNLLFEDQSLLMNFIDVLEAK